MAGKIAIDVETASLDELKKVQGLIMSRLSRDVHAKVDNASPYDSHGSNHTNHSGKTFGGIATNPVANPVNR